VNLSKILFFFTKLDGELLCSTLLLCCVVVGESRQDGFVNSEIVSDVPVRICNLISIRLVTKFHVYVTMHTLLIYECTVHSSKLV